MQIIVIEIEKFDSLMEMDVLSKAQQKKKKTKTKLFSLNSRKNLGVNITAFL